MATTNNKRRTKSAIGRSETLRRILKLFVAPFFDDLTVRHDTEDVLTAKLELWFDIKNRDIVLCKAKREFKLPGPMWASPDTPSKYLIHGYGDRTVPAGAALWVRYDQIRPEFVEIEVDTGIFRVQSTDWYVLKDYVEELA